MYRICRVLLRVEEKLGYVFPSLLRWAVQVVLRHGVLWHEVIQSPHIYSATPHTYSTIPLLSQLSWTMSPVNEQPISAAVMNSTKRPVTVEHENPCGAGRLMHKPRLYKHLRHSIIPAIFLLLAAASLLFLEFSDLGSGVGASGGLLRRAAGDTTGNNSPFVKNKRMSYYLLISSYGI